MSVLDAESLQHVADLLPNLLAVIKLDARLQIDLDTAAGALFECDVQIGSNIASGAPCRGFSRDYFSYG